MRIRVQLTKLLEANLKGLYNVMLNFNSSKERHKQSNFILKNKRFLLKVTKIYYKVRFTTFKRSEKQKHLPEIQFLFLCTFELWVTKWVLLYLSAGSFTKSNHNHPQVIFPNMISSWATASGPVAWNNYIMAIDTFFRNQILQNGF